MPADGVRISRHSLMYLLLCFSVFVLQAKVVEEEESTEDDGNDKSGMSKSQRKRLRKKLRDAATAGK